MIPIELKVHTFFVLMNSATNCRVAISKQYY